MARIIFLIFALGICKMAEALYSGNPDEPELIDTGIFLGSEGAFGLKLGYQGDFVFDRKLHLKGCDYGNVDRFQSRMNQGVLSVNFMNRIELAGSVGAMNSNFIFHSHKDERKREFQTEDHITWGASARLLLFNWGNAHIGATGSYQYCRPKVQWESVDCRTISTCAKMKYWEWQVAALIAYRADILDPYIGVSYSPAEVLIYHVNHEHQSKLKMKSRDRVGMMLGCSLTSSKIVDLTVEVRLFDEEAISLAGNIRF